jgi:hypothetical protein
MVNGYGWTGMNPAAVSEYEGMYAGDKGSRNYTYTDLTGKEAYNPQAIGKGVLDALTSMPAQVAMGLTGMSPVAAALSLVSALADGKVGNASQIAASVLGGKGAGAVVGLLGSLLEGREGSALQGMINSGLGYAGMGLGSTLQGNYGRGTTTGALAGMLGNLGQNWGVGQALSQAGITNSNQSMLSGHLGGMQNTTEGDSRWQK